MMVNGFSLPRDFTLLGSILIRVLYYLWVVQKKQLPPEQIISRIRLDSEKMISTSDKEQFDKQISRLIKIRRIANIWLIKIMRQEKPCLVRAYVVLESALRSGVAAKAVIGAKMHSNHLFGHAWIEICGEPFLEDPDQLSQYIIMTSG